MRLALGATQRDVTRKILGQGFIALAVGAGIGLVLSLFAQGVLADLLWGIEATDLPTYMVGIGIVASSGLAAIWISTRRATEIDPVRAIKAD